MKVYDMKRTIPDAYCPYITGVCRSPVHLSPATVSWEKAYRIAHTAFKTLPLSYAISHTSIVFGADLEDESTGD
jgi:hypothetical protein